MAEKDFYSLLKDKMAALKPSEKHRDSDWEALSKRLNDISTQAPQSKRRGLVLPLLLAVALLSSNAAWWNSTQNDQKKLAALETQTLHLQKSFEALCQSVGQSAAVHHRDTLWRTVYVMQRPLSSVFDINPITGGEASLQPPKSQGLFQSPYPGRENQPTTAPDQAFTDAIVGANPSESPVTDTLNTQKQELGHIDTTSERLPTILTEPHKQTRTLAQKLGQALRPRHFKAGVQAGWASPHSKQLMHRGGYSLGTQVLVGVSRHWALTADLSLNQFHYKAHESAAILGSPTLPMVPTNGHHYTAVDVTGQKSLNWGVSVRHLFSQPGKPRPYLGMGWATQMLFPFFVEYEIQHEPSGTIEKGIYQITARTHQYNHFQLSGGLDMPLYKRWNLTLEAFYQRQWKKPSPVAPDLVGLRAGAHWIF